MDAEKADVFHTTIAKSLFLCNTSRPNIQPAVLLFCTIVKRLDEENWRKLLRMIKYLQETLDEKPTLKINDITMIDLYANSAFEVHTDMKIHIGGVLTMGKGLTQQFQ